MNVVKVQYKDIQRVKRVSSYIVVQVSSKTRNLLQVKRAVRKINSTKKIVFTQPRHKITESSNPIDFISTDNDNALQLGSDGKFFIPKLNIFNSRGDKLY